MESINEKIIFFAMVFLAISGCNKNLTLDDKDPSGIVFNKARFCRYQAFKKFPQNEQSRVVQESQAIRVPWGPEVCGIRSGLPMCHQPMQVAGYDMVTVRRDIDVNADARQNFVAACLRVSSEQIENFVAQY